MIISEELDVANGVLCTVEYDPLISTIDVMNWLITDLEARCKIQVHEDAVCTVVAGKRLIKRSPNNMWPNGREKDMMSKFFVTKEIV